MQDVIDSVGYDRAVELIKYYFDTNKSGHPLNFFIIILTELTSYKKKLKKIKQIAVSY